MDELEALRSIDLAFSSMDEAARVRAFEWLAAKYAIDVPRQNAARAEDLPPSAAKQTQISMTARAVATAFSAQTGTDLVESMAAYLAVVSRLETFSRQQLLDAMKSATGYFKPTYRGNLSSYIETLCKKGILIEVSPEVYTVKAAALRQLTQKLEAANGE